MSSQCSLLSHVIEGVPPSIPVEWTLSLSLSLSSEGPRRMSPLLTLPPLSHAIDAFHALLSTVDSNMVASHGRRGLDLEPDRSGKTPRYCYCYCTFEFTSMLFHSSTEQSMNRFGWMGLVEQMNDVLPVMCLRLLRSPP